MRWEEKRTEAISTWMDKKNEKPDWQYGGMLFPPEAICGTAAIKKRHRP